MPAVLRLPKEEIDTPEKREKFLLTVLGCEQEAVSYALAFAEAGFKVICASSDQSFVKKVSKGNLEFGNRQSESKLRSFLRSEKISASADVKAAVSKSDIIIITVNAKLDANKTIDKTELEGNCRQVGAALQKGSLLVYAGLAGFGSADNIIKDTLENASGLKAGEDFGFAYISPPNFITQGLTRIGEEDLKIAANDKFSLNSAVLVFEAIAKKGLRKITSIKAAELAKLFSSARQDVDIAFANELAIFCESANVDYVEIMKVLEVESCKKYVNPSIAEEDNRKETYLLLESAENFTAKLRLPTLARQINEDMVRHALNLTQDALRNCGKTLRRARVALLGDVESGEASAALMEMLETKGAKISRYDPDPRESEKSEGASSVKKTLIETVEAADCVVILSDLEPFKRLSLKKLHAVMRSPAALIDLAGIIEPSKVQGEGFVYRGLGRGAWKK